MRRPAAPKDNVGNKVGNETFFISDSIAAKLIAPCENRARSSSVIVTPRSRFLSLVKVRRVSALF